MAAVAKPSPTDLAREFAALFRGLDRAHGRYLVPAGAGPNGKGKVEGKPWTDRRPLERADWEAHLSGESVTVRHGDGHLTGTLSLGIVPVRDDDSCCFGAIDVDTYPLDLPKLAGAVLQLGLPLVPCRSKSGGAHLYLFTDGSTSAELVRRKLMEWAIALGHPGVEVFPKQTHLASERDEGSWINLPYAGGDRSTRYGLDERGKALSLATFVEVARSRRVGAADLEATEPAFPDDDDVDDVLAGGPPCLRALARMGFIEAYRNNSLFNLGVYAKKRYGDDEFGQYVDAFNGKFMSPPLSSQDVQATIKSLRRKNYSYRCKDPPIAQVCNRQVCLGCEHGVGGGSGDPGVVLGELVKLQTQPPTWLWDVDGARIELTTAELMDQRSFQQRVVDELNKWPALVKPPVWQAIVRERLARVEVLPVPDDATRRGQFWLQLTAFCTSRVVGRSMDELLLGKPYTDEAAGITYFCSKDFIAYLQQHRFGAISEKAVYAWLRERGVSHGYALLKGKGVNYWALPAFRAQTEEHDVPRAPVERM